MILRRGSAVALIERRRAGRTYYLFPGGGVEAGETAEVAAAREAKEELGVDVVVEDLVAEVEFAGRRQLFFSATIVGGDFGSGTGEELESHADSELGSYTPRWIETELLVRLDVRPRALAVALVAGCPRAGWPLRFADG